MSSHCIAINSYQQVVPIKSIVSVEKLPKNEVKLTATGKKKKQKTVSIALVTPALPPL